MIEAGFCRLDITPPMETLMGGHPGIKHSQSVLDSLHCRAMILKSNSTFFVWISADLLFLHEETIYQTRKTVNRELGISPERVFINATHTHSGPLTTDLFGASKEQDYVQSLPNKFLLACQNALKNLRPARLGFGQSQIQGVAFNARYIMKDGSIETHPQKGNPCIVEPEGPVDEQLVAMLVCDMEGKLLGAVVNYANHPQYLSRRDPRISADFPGRLEKYVRYNLSDKVVVLFGNGACGNICPVNALDVDNIELGESFMDKTGKILAKNVAKIFVDTHFKEEAEILFETHVLRIPIRQISEASLLQAKRFLEETDTKTIEEVELSDYGTEVELGNKLSLSQYLKTNLWKRQECTDLLALAETRNRNPVENCEISVVAIGSSAIVMAPFELFVELGLEIKSKSPFKNTIIIELANGYSGYVPTEKAFSRPGGYETLTLQSSKLAAGAGDILVAAVINMCNRLRIHSATGSTIKSAGCR